MKKDIHPKYMDCQVRCGCGTTWETRSTVPEIKVEVCSSCHPFFQEDGANRLVDTLGRVDRFTKKFGGDYFSKASKPKKVVSKRAY